MNAEPSPVLVVFEVRRHPAADADAIARYSEYVARVMPLIEAAGGRYLARAATPEFLEGAPDDDDVRRFHVIEFASADAVRDFWSSAEYRAIVPLRDGAVDVRAVVLR